MALGRTPRKFGIDIRRQIDYNAKHLTIDTSNGGEEFHVRSSNGGLDTEGASRPDGEPAGESLRSKDPTKFYLWKVERLEAPDADGASPDNSSRRISQANKQRTRDKESRVLCSILDSRSNTGPKISSHYFKL